MSDRNEDLVKRWEVGDMIRAAIKEHELEKENKFVFKYELQSKEESLSRRLVDLEEDAKDAKDRNKWLFRLVVGAIITSLIPIVIALLSQSQGNILK